MIRVNTVFAYKKIVYKAYASNGSAKTQPSHSNQEEKSFPGRQNCIIAPKLERTKIVQPKITRDPHQVKTKQQKQYLLTSSGHSSFRLFVKSNSTILSMK